MPDDVVPITTNEENKTHIPPLPNTSAVVVLRTEKQRRPLLMEAVAILKAWFFSPDHAAHLYPTKPEKVRLLQQTGLNKTQLSDWLRNAHKRIWEPPRLITYAPRSIAAPESIAAPGPKRQKQNQVTPADALVQHQKNIKYFENHFGVTFTIPDKAENNIVTVIPKSHPKAIAEASVTNTTMPLSIASAEHDRNFVKLVAYYR